MDSVHVHLMTVHLPVLGALFGLGLSILGLLKRSEELQRTSLLVFFLAAASTAPAYLSGQPASQMLTRLTPALSMNEVDRHADVALLSLAASVVLGLIALAGGWLFRRTERLPRWFVIAIIAIASFSSALMVWTANLGGKVRHTEIRSLPTAFKATPTFLSAGYEAFWPREPRGQETSQLADRNVGVTQEVSHLRLPGDSDHGIVAGDSRDL